MQIWDGFGIFLLVPRRRSGECPSDFSSGWVCPWDWRPHPLTRPASSWLCQQLCLMVNTGSKPSTLTFHQGKTLIKPTFSKQSPHRRWRVKTAEAASAFATPRLLGFNNPTFVGYARYFTSTVGKVVRLTKKWTLQSRIMLLKYLLFNRKSAHTVTEWDTGYTLDITGHTPFPPSLSPPPTHTPGHTPRGNFESLNNLRWACSLLWEKTRVPFFFFKSRGKGNFREKNLWLPDFEGFFPFFNWWFLLACTGMGSWWTYDVWNLLSWRHGSRLELLLA